MQTSTNKVREVLYEPYFTLYSLEGTLDEVIRNLENLRDEVGEGVSIEIWDPDGGLGLIRYRDPTQAEIDRAEAAKALMKEQRRKQFEALKSEFEGEQV